MKPVFTSAPKDADKEEQMLKSDHNPDFRGILHVFKNQLLRCNQTGELNSLGQGKSTCRQTACLKWNVELSITLLRPRGQSTLWGLSVRCFLAPNSIQ